MARINPPPPPQPPASRQKLAGEVYPFKAVIHLVSIKGPPLVAKVEYLDLSNRLHNGRFFEGTLTTSNRAYFHWFSFDPNTSSRAYLYTHPAIEDFAKIVDRRFPQGILSNAEVTEILRRTGPLSDIGALAEELCVSQTNLVSDVSNYPWNLGYFAVKDGRLLEEGQFKTTGSHWTLVKNRFTRILEARILHFPLTQSQLSDIEFGLYLCPVVVNGNALHMDSLIPGTGEMFLYSFRGSTSHTFVESNAKAHRSIQRLIENSRLSMSPELAALLREEGALEVGAETHRQAAPHRAVYGHTILGITKSGKFVILKIFNRAAKDNGLYLEQAGDAMLELSRIFENDEIIFAGIGANGGDVRTFLGRTRRYKNTSEDAQTLQEKIEGPNPRLRKPILLVI